MTRRECLGGVARAPIEAADDPTLRSLSQERTVLDQLAALEDMDRRAADLEKATRRAAYRRD